VKLPVDMNLAPSWAGRLALRGYESVHWSAVGAPTSPDVEILTWARENDFIVVTNDLDFSAILAATSGRAPSVVQVRMQDLMSDAAVDAVVAALEACRESVAVGALLSIDESGTRVRMLPLGHHRDGA
jgi:predicted nuclease of predicted toxin-antitoxin system